MATSGSSDFNQTRTEIIQDALALIGVYGVGRTVSSEDMEYCANAFNRMVKSWQAKGLHLWSKEEAYLFPDADTSSFVLSSASTSARTVARHSLNETTISADEAASQTTISVTSSTSMTAADIIGIELDTGSVHWSTVGSVPDGTSVVIDDALPSAAASGNQVFSFTNRIEKPLRILSVRRIRDLKAASTASGTTEIPMLTLSSQEYFDLPSKNISGLPTHYYYNPDLTDGRLYLWPMPENNNIYFGITYERPLEDMDAAGNNPDFPAEWLDALTYQLAYRLAPAFGKDKNMVQPEASELLRDLLDWDTEVESVYFIFDQRK